MRNRKLSSEKERFSKAIQISHHTGENGKFKFVHFSSFLEFLLKLIYSQFFVELCSCESIHYTLVRKTFAYKIVSLYNASIFITTYFRAIISIDM